MKQPTIRDLQQARLAYPEAAWIARCGNLFPSHTQWLYKYLPKVDLIPKPELDEVIKENPLITATTNIMKNKSTAGSGKTLAGEKIHEKVSLDWVKWAIAKKVWNIIYTREKINSTQGGGELITNEVKEVLNVAVDEGIFISYKITEVIVDSRNNNLSVKFTAELEHTILSAEVSGSLYY